MSFDDLPPALRDWLRNTIRSGVQRSALLDSLISAGYRPDYAEAALSAAWGALSAPSVVASELRVVDPAVLAPQDLTATRPATSATPNRIDVDGHVVELRMALASPRVVLFGNLLSADECDELIELSRHKLERSSVVNAATGDYDIHPHRTSLGTHFRRGENALIARIEGRIAKLLEFPVEHGEPVQILYYRPGAEYRPHFDYFDPALPGNDKVLAMGGQRVATVVMYLNDCEVGGATVFPQIGLEVTPQKGDAVYFAYVAADGALDERSLHGGAVVEKGEKWIATKWLREFEYQGPSA